MINQFMSRVLQQSSLIRPLCHMFQFGTAIHEIGHALGMYHEQQRPDRDDWIIVNEEAVRSDFLSQYNIKNSVTLDIPYDTGSIMQYGPWVSSFFLFPRILPLIPPDNLLPKKAQHGMP